MDIRTKIDPLANGKALIARDVVHIGLRSRAIDSPTAGDGCRVIATGYRML
jgi:hypothetical protein